MALHGPGPVVWRRATGSSLAPLSACDSLPRRFFRRLGQPVGRFGLGGKLYPFQDWLEDCVKPELNVDPNRIVALYDEHLPDWATASSVDQAQRTDLRSYLLEDILVKVDRMSMLHSLEVRSPFLDYRLVELGLSIPSRLRARNGINKYLLRRLATRYLPKSVCWAPKRGFGVPMRSWLYGKLDDHVLRGLLVSDQNDYPGPFLPGGGNRLWQLGRENPALVSAVALVLCYHWWCQGRVAS